MFTKLLVSISILGISSVLVYLGVESSVAENNLVQKGQGQIQQGRGRAFQRAHELPDGCSQRKRVNEPRKKTRRDEILSDAAASGVSDKELDDLQKLTQENSNIINENPTGQQIGDEIILKNSISQSQVIVPRGVIKCRASDEYTDKVIGSEEGVTFIGGPFDNQQTSK